ncbi:MAG: magnesium/cobalt transporter CorA [Planctomycetota bacterium]|jgi:magnesium transporter
MARPSDETESQTAATDLAISMRGQPGTAPGTLLADPEAAPTRLQVMVYDSTSCEEHPVQTAEEIPSLNETSVAWISVIGLGDLDTLRRVGEVLGMHRLALEDVVNAHQRPKCEDYDDRLYITLRAPRGDEVAETEQVSLFLGPGFVATFHEHSHSELEPVRRRIREGKGKIRVHGADYLAYAILDAVTDAYFPVLEEYGEKLETLEGEALERPVLDTLLRIRDLKRQLMMLRRIIWSMRELFNSVLRDPTPLIGEETRLYFRDCYDHAVQLVDVTENYRELATGLMDVYLSSTGNRMNEIMKVLTIMASVFIPLTFLAGIYGMNFETMPELKWPLGYPLAVSVMVAVALGMFVYFRRKGWTGQRRRHRDDELPMGKSVL